MTMSIRSAIIPQMGTSNSVPLASQHVRAGVKKGHSIVETVVSETE